MNVVIQLSLLTAGVCVGAVILLAKTSKTTVRRRDDIDVRISVAPVSGTWLSELKARPRIE